MIILYDYAVHAYVLSFVLQKSVTILKIFKMSTKSWQILQIFAARSVDFAGISQNPGVIPLITESHCILQKMSRHFAEIMQSPADRLWHFLVKSINNSFGDKSIVRAILAQNAFLTRVRKSLRRNWELFTSISTPSLISAFLRRCNSISEKW